MNRLFYILIFVSSSIYSMDNKTQSLWKQINWIETPSEKITLTELFCSIQQIAHNLSSIHAKIEKERCIPDTKKTRFLNTLSRYLNGARSFDPPIPITENLASAMDGYLRWYHEAEPTLKALTHELDAYMTSAQEPELDSIAANLNTLSMNSN